MEKLNFEVLHQFSWGRQSQHRQQARNGQAKLDKQVAYNTREIERACPLYFSN